jgi:hypothetical protein
MKFKLTEPIDKNHSNMSSISLSVVFTFQASFAELALVSNVLLSRRIGPDVQSTSER